MRRVLMLGALIAFAVWRKQKLDAHDKAHGYGAYAPVRPIVD